MGINNVMGQQWDLGVVAALLPPPSSFPLCLLAHSFSLVLTQCRRFCGVPPPSLLPSFAFLPSRPRYTFSTRLSRSTPIPSSSSLCPSSAMLVLSLPPPIYSFLSHASLSFPSPPPSFLPHLSCFLPQGEGERGRRGRRGWRGKGERSEEGGCFNRHPGVPISPPTHLPVKQTT